MKKKETIYVDVYALDGKLDEVITYLQKVVDDAPVAASEIYFEISSYEDYGSHGVTCEAYYFRDMTEKEIAEKKERERAYAERKIEQLQAALQALKEDIK